MSEVTDELRVKVKFETDQAQASVKEFDRKIEDTGRKAQEATQKTEGFLGRALSTAAGTAFGGLAMQALQRAPVVGALGGAFGASVEAALGGIPGASDIEARLRRAQVRIQSAQEAAQQFGLPYSMANDEGKHNIEQVVRRLADLQSQKAFGATELARAAGAGAAQDELTAAIKELTGVIKREKTKNPDFMAGSELFR